MNKRDIELKKFDKSRIKPYNTCIFIGKRQSGKTVLLKDILYDLKGIPIGNIISGTGSITRDFHNMVPRHLIRKCYKPEIVQKIFETQEKRINRLHHQLEHSIPSLKERMDYIKADINNYCFVVMDDCLSDKKAWKNDPQLMKIFAEGRHYLIFFIMTMQAPLGLPPDMRSNVDFVFLTFTNNNQDIKKIYDIFGGCFKSQSEFRAILQACTEDYNCLVIDNVVNKNRIEDRVFHYKAPIRSEFRMCHQSLWDEDKKKMDKLNNRVDKKIHSHNTEYNIAMEK